MDNIRKCILCKERNGINYVGEYICIKCWKWYACVRLYVKETYQKNKEIGWS